LHSDPGEQSAIDQIVSARAKCGSIGQEKRRKLGNFFDGADPPERMRRPESLDDRIDGQVRRKMGSRALEHGGANGSRADGIDANAIRRMVQRESARQAKKSAL
jgi:hypothetical protein